MSGTAGREMIGKALMRRENRTAAVRKGVLKWP